MHNTFKLPFNSACAFCLAALITACGDDVSGPVVDAGTYTLVSMDGQDIPAIFVTPAVPGVDGMRTIYESSTIEFHGDSATYRVAMSREWPQNTFRDVIIEETGEVTLQAGNRLLLLRRESPSGGPLVVVFQLVIESWSADSLVVDGDRPNMIYRRNR